MSDQPTSPQVETDQMTDHSAAPESAAASDSSQTPDGVDLNATQSSTAIGGKLWLFLGVMAAILMTVVVTFVVPALEPGFPAEYETLDPGNGADTQRIGELEAEQDAAYRQVLLAVAGMTTLLTFGLVAFAKCGNKPRGLIGFVLATGLVVACSFLLPTMLVEREALAMKDLTGGDVKAILIHLGVWLVMLLPAGLVIAIASGRPVEGVKAIVAAVLAAALGALAYVMLPVLFDPGIRVHVAQPAAGLPTVIWGCTAPLLFGLFLYRTLKPAEMAAE